jgi:lipopolysaccharide O-acetyltransferase
MTGTLISMRTRLQRYGVFGAMKLAVDYLFTRLSYPSMRLARLPFRVRGRGGIRWGSGLTTGVGVRLDVFRDDGQPALFFGDDVQLNDHVHIGAVERVEIGNQVLIASRVFISDHNHGDYGRLDLASAPTVPPAQRPVVGKPVRIGDRVWLGEQVCVLPGVSIGEGAIIGAGAVVTRDIPPNVIAVGNPARVIRVFNEQSGAWLRI